MGGKRRTLHQMSQRKIRPQPLLPGRGDTRCMKEIGYLGGKQTHLCRGQNLILIVPCEDVYGSTSIHY